MQFIGMCCVKNIDTKITGLTGIEWGCSDLIKFIKKKTNLTQKKVTNFLGIATSTYHYMNPEIY